MPQEDSKLRPLPEIEQAHDLVKLAGVAIGIGDIKTDILTAHTVRACLCCLCWVLGHDNPTFDMSLDHLFKQLEKGGLGPILEDWGIHAPGSGPSNGEGWAESLEGLPKL